MIAGIPFVLAGQLKTNTPHYIHYLGSVRHRGHKFGSYFFFFFFFHLCRAARVVEEPAEDTTTSGK